jgi:hypothetical protein
MEKLTYVLRVHVIDSKEELFCYNNSYIYFFLNGEIMIYIKVIEEKRNGKSTRGTRPTQVRKVQIGLRPTQTPSTLSSYTIEQINTPFIEQTWRANLFSQ